MASRYASFESRSSGSSSSTQSTSADLRRALKSKPPSLDVVKAKPCDMVAKNGRNFGSMVKKFMEKKTSKTKNALPVPIDPIARESKKVAEKVSGFSGLHRKLFQKGGSEEKTATKALTESKANTRTLAMVLRSERELLAQTKEYEGLVVELRVALEEKNREVDKLKDLCLRQREEIKALKDAILFPDVMNAHLQALLERQGSELKEAKLVIPTLQKQVSSLTGQLQCLAEDLAEVKADKYSGKSSDGPFNSPRTPMYQREPFTSLDLCSSDNVSSMGPDDILFGDLNPCLTPCFSKSKSKGSNKLTTCESP